MFQRYLAVAACLCVFSSVAVARQINHSQPDANGNVTWGPGPHKDAVDDKVPAAPGGGRGSRISFFWTLNGLQHPDFAAYDESNSTSTARDRHFKRPVPAANRPAITDWEQRIGYTDSLGNLHDSSVKSGNIKNGPRAWTFAPLDELDGILGRIPDFGPSVNNLEPSDLIIYAAVNLGLYLQSNPLGFSGGNWLTGQTLNSTGMQVVNGQIVGLQGMYFASVPFTFDAGSATGWVPSTGNSGWLNSADWQTAHGDIQILGEHDVPAPGPAVCMLAAGALALRRGRKN